MSMWKQNTWLMFHIITKNFDEQYVGKYEEFFNSFRSAIPCSICRKHYNQNISKPGMTLSENMNNDRIFNWTIDLHNSVNRMHNKRAWEYSIANNVYNTELRFDTVKMFIYEYFFYNFKRGPDKTEGLFNMLRSLAYVYPNKVIRDKLIDFTSKFQLTRESAKKWMYAYMLIIKNR